MGWGVWCQERLTHAADLHHLIMSPYLSMSPGPEDKTVQEEDALLVHFTALYRAVKKTRKGKIKGCHIALYLFFILLAVVKTLLHSRQNPHLVYS